MAPRDGVLPAVAGPGTEEGLLEVAPRDLPSGTGTKTRDLHFTHHHVTHIYVSNMVVSQRRTHCAKGL